MVVFLLTFFCSVRFMPVPMHFTNVNVLLFTTRNTECYLPLCSIGTNGMFGTWSPHDTQNGNTVIICPCFFFPMLYRCI